MAEEKDPLSKLLDVQWQMLEARAAFTSLVPEGNRIKFNTEYRSPEKKEILSADAPSLKIVPKGGLVGLTVSSSHTKFTKKYLYVVDTADFRVHKYLYPLEIATVAALIHWPEYLLPLTWKGHPFATLLRMGDVNEGTNEADQKVIKGWSVFLSVSIDIHLFNNDLLGVL